MAEEAPDGVAAVVGIIIKGIDDIAVVDAPPGSKVAVEAPPGKGIESFPGIGTVGGGLRLKPVRGRGGDAEPGTGRSPLPAAVIAAGPGRPGTVLLPPLPPLVC